jgi:hypothetical protein
MGTCTRVREVANRKTLSSVAIPAPEALSNLEL